MFKRTLAVLTAFLFSLPVYSSDYSVSARQVRDVSYSSSGATVDYSLQAKFAANDPRYKTKKVKYGPGKVLDFAKSRKTLNPAAAAVNAVVIGVVAAAGWAIDELTNQVTRPNANPTFEDDGSWQAGKFWAVSGYSPSSVESYAPTRSVACSRVNGVYSSSFNSCAIPNPDGSNSYKQPIKYTCGKWSSTSSMASYSGCGLEPSLPSEPVPESEWWPQVMDAISQMSPEAQREFWNNVAGMPELTPELQAALDDWNAEIASETGLNGETKEESSSDTANDIQDVRVVELPKLLTDFFTFDSPAQPEVNALEQPLIDLKLDIDSIPESSPLLPEIPFYSYLIGVGSSGTCGGFTLTNYLGGEDILINQHCSFIEDKAKPVFGFVMAVATLLYLFSLYRVETSRGF